MQRLPDAELVMHHFGARHMIDQQNRLGIQQKSTAKSFPNSLLSCCPSTKRVIQATDGMRITLGERELTCIDTPGHARHHICIWDQQSRGIFSGDTFGLAYPELTTEQRSIHGVAFNTDSVRPESWHRTIDRLMALQPSRM